MTKGTLWGVLTDQSPLLEAAPARFEEVEAHHLTLRHGVDLTPFQDAVGKTFEAHATAEAWNEDIQAVRVDLPAEIAPLCENRHPHVTLSHRAGVPAKTSNALLENPPHERSLDLKLRFRIETQAWSS